MVSIFRTPIKWCILYCMCDSSSLSWLSLSNTSVFWLLQHGLPCAWRALSCRQHFPKRPLWPDFDPRKPRRVQQTSLCSWDKWVCQPVLYYPSVPTVSAAGSECTRGSERTCLEWDFSVMLSMLIMLPWRCSYGGRIERLKIKKGLELLWLHFEGLGTALRHVL